MTKTKRIHHFVDKKAIATSIDLYNKIEFCTGNYDVTWDTYWESLADICPTNSWAVRCAVSSIFQQMYFANTLTVDRIYELILVSGVNTTEVQIDD